MGMGNTLRRGRLQHKYHLCGRCGVRYPLSELTWQNDVLVCYANCYDTMLAEQRDAELARKEAQAGESRELQPDFKITDGVTLDVDDISFIP